jgi:hypothetical protein
MLDGDTCSLLEAEEVSRAIPAAGKHFP